jgi:hypothetical protein
MNQSTFHSTVVGLPGEIQVALRGGDPYLFENA